MMKLITSHNDPVKRKRKGIKKINFHLTCHVFYQLKNSTQFRLLLRLFVLFQLFFGMEIENKIYGAF